MNDEHSMIVHVQARGIAADLLIVTLRAASRFPSCAPPVSRARRSASSRIVIASQRRFENRFRLTLESSLRSFSRPPLEGSFRTFFTTTTEYLVEALDALDEIGVNKSHNNIAPEIRRRMDAVAIEARRLANLR
jgi:hypothetical protein